MTTAHLARYIDHTLLRADASANDITKLCHEAREFNFWSVCVNPCWISFCREQLKGSAVRVCTVIGFPLGANDSATKAFEAQNAVQNGADELDMVLNIGFVKSARWHAVGDDIVAVVKAAGLRPVKVILETSLLSDDEKIKSCQEAMRAGAAFVKTSTGFSTAGATVEDVRLMKQTVGDHLKVKASGGVRDLASLQKMIAAGAERIGTSSATQFLAGQKADEGY
ncbi:MAG: deoxyribose-phosphate aldolase [Bdellovibrionales bacterium]